MTAKRTRSEEGVALVTVLMIVAAMSAVAVMLSAAVLSSTNRARALDASAQADWFAAGAAQFARATLENLLGQTGPALFTGMPLLSEPVSFTVEGGRIALTARDASNCFNLNSLRNAAPEGGAEAGDTPARDFERLLELAGFRDIGPEQLTAALTDWMDADQSPGLGGAEDSYYASLRPPYRTPGQPMQNLSELNAVRYMTPALADEIGPLVCVREAGGQQVLNVNTLSEAEAPLLSVAMSGVLTADAARDIVFQRPPGGWESVAAMMEVPALARIAPDKRRTDMLSVVSTHIGVRAVIEYRGLRRTYELLFALGETGSVELVRQERKG